MRKPTQKQMSEAVAEIFWDGYIESSRFTDELLWIVEEAYENAVVYDEYGFPESQIPFIPDLAKNYALWLKEKGPPPEVVEEVRQRMKMSHGFDNFLETMQIMTGGPTFRGRRLSAREAFDDAASEEAEAINYYAWEGGPEERMRVTEEVIRKLASEFVDAEINQDFDEV